MTPTTDASNGPLLNQAGLALTYYGDDFTGSTDVMEALTLAGLPTVLFLDAPTPDQVAAHPDAVAVGVAGVSRTMSPAEMDVTLPGILTRLADLRAPVFHYKICSTFDSSPHVGSIGRAAEIVCRIFPGGPIPLVVGVPELGRYCAFGTLFATTGDRVRRLDRHPTMMTHPVTPMTESDLLVHLSAQTGLPTTLVDLRALSSSDDVVDAEVDRAMASGADVVLFDLVDPATERQVGRTLDRLVRDRRTAGGGTLAVIGSSGVEYALGLVWNGVPDRGMHRVGLRAAANLDDVKQTLVIAGSRAPETDVQVLQALGAGFAHIPVDPHALTSPRTGVFAVAAAATAAAEAWGRGEHVLVTTPAKTGAGDVDGTCLATALGELARAIGTRVPIGRLVVAGGDTSGLVARALSIEALRLLEPLARGAPLCRVTSSDPRFNGLEVCLKAGKLGTPDYFIRIAGLASSVRA